MQIIKAGSSIGTDIAGVDLAHLDSAEFRGIYGAWLESSVLRFRDQELTKDQLRAFSERFGPLEYAPMGKITPEQRASIPNPYVTNVSNIVENGRPIGGLGSAEANWHTDMSYIEHPPTASILMAVEVPEVGGDTEFCDMHAAFEAMPDDLSDRVRTLSIKHDAAHDSIGGLRHGFDHSASPVEAPGWVHPMIRIHEETRRDALYLGRRQDAYVLEMDLDESDTLLNTIWDYVALEGHSWIQHWRNGDVVMWDNRSVMHRRMSFPASSRRLMHRTQVRPVL
ncbi:MAG: TauD/TfdA family dioxygenase [Pseudomonadales bacterium]